MIEKQPPTGAGAPAAVIERLLRRSLLLLLRDRSIAQDWLDLAELAGVVGAPDVAQLARDVARLRLGFGSGHSAVGDAPMTSIDRATDEMRSLMEHSLDEPPVLAADIADAVMACHTLVGLLAAPSDADSDAKLAALIGAIESAPPADPREHVQGDLGRLVSAFAASEIQDFVRRHYDIARPPYGSARLLHASAQFDRGGLGPYLVDAVNIFRNSQDIIGLIALAAGDAAAVDQVVRWVVPLTACLPERLVGDLIDDLADLGLMSPLEGLLAACARRNDTPTPLRRLRDAGLDLGDFSFALRVQAQILAKWPYDVTEWRRAGDIRATAGDDDGALAAFAYALRLAPADAETEAHRIAQRAGDFEEYTVRAGFNTPRHRHLARSARRVA